jgi:aubergine-like protein
MVMANYGKNRCYIIDSILFDVALESYQFTHNDKCVNILEYYSHCYDIAVQAKRQPLLKARNNRKSKDKEKETEIILIPELCLMSGLPDDFDERKRREVSDYTITNAQAKFHEIQNVFKNLNNNENEYNPQTIGEKLGIKLSNTPQSITAKQIQYPELQLGDKQRVEENKTTNFMLFNKFLFSRDVTLKICIILPSDFDFGPTKRLLESTTSSIGLQYRSSMNTINYSDNKMAMKKIENIIQDESESKTSNIFWFIIPSNYKTQYKTLKRMTLKSGVEINSQVTVSSNLEKKGSPSIFTKILLQMAAKVGNKLWVPRISPKIQNSGVMLIGIETTKDS